MATIVGDYSLQCGQGFTMVFACVYSVVENTLYATTPPTNETRLVPIDVETADGLRFDTSLTFEYRKNPRFFDIRPRNHLTV